MGHHDGFDKAMNDALTQASKWGPGTYDVQVDHGACIEVINPGAIGEYRVKLTEI